MKTFKLFLVAALATASTFVSCSNDDFNSDNQAAPSANSAEQLVKNEPKDYTITKVDTLTAEQYADKVFGTTQVSPNVADNELMAQRQQAKQEFLSQCQNAEGVQSRGSYATCFFQTTTFEYQSLDENNKPVTLSAFMAWAINPFTDNPISQHRLRLVCPYTHTLETECATESKGGEEFHFTLWNDLFIMPDGEGFGSSKGRDQLYCNHNVQAKQLYDAMKTGFKIYTDEYNGKLDDGWTTIVCGTSQGAGDAMAVHKLLDTQKENGVPLRDIWNFQYSFVCCGPYCPAATMQAYWRDGYVNYPCVLPLSVKSMLASNPDLAKKYKESDFYSDAYNANKAKYDDLVTNKKLSADELNKVFVKDLKGEGATLPIELKYIVNEKLFDTDSDIYKDFMNCLDKQDLTKDWTPVTPSYVYYSTKDEYVDVDNSFRLMGLLQRNGCLKDATDTGLGHVKSCYKFILTRW